MKIKKPKYKGNMEEFNTSTNPDGDDRINDLLAILEDFEWSIASKVNPKTNELEGFVVGNDDFINEVLSKLDESGNDVDINTHYLGDREDLN